MSNQIQNPNDKENLNAKAQMPNQIPMSKLKNKDYKPLLV
jgi:hypothetical protein